MSDGADARESLEEIAPSEADGTADPWRRLDARMLLVHPLETLVRFLPALLAVLLFRSGSDDHDRWELYAVPVIVAYGVLRWLTTRYRIADGQVELRRGVLTRQTTTARLDRVRTVDLTARPYHRLLGLAKVEISTAGGGRERLVLDSLSAEHGRRLRAELLHRVDAPAADAPVEASAPVGDELLVRLDPAWLRYAPLTLTGLASAAAIVGFASQGFSRYAQERSVFRAGAGWVAGLVWWADVLLLLGAVSALAVAAYLLTFWGFRLTRNRLGTMHTRRGLLTRRETTIDAARVRGIRIDEPLGLRLAGARRLKVVTTGLLRERGGSDWLCPPAPADVVTSVALRIRPDREAVEGALIAHGHAAAHRRLTRTLVPATLASAGLVAARLLWDWHGSLLVVVPLLLIGAVALGRDRYRSLGHAVTADHLVTRHGSLDRQRVVLDRDGIIGWTVRRSFFQRRAGLATLVATTAAGEQHYDIVDVPVERAYAVLAQVSPALLAEATPRYESSAPTKRGA